MQGETPKWGTYYGDFNDLSLCPMATKLGRSDPPYESVEWPGSKFSAWVNNGRPSWGPLPAAMAPTPGFGICSSVPSLPARLSVPRPGGPGLPRVHQVCPCFSIASTLGPAWTPAMTHPLSMTICTRRMSLSGRRVLSASTGMMEVQTVFSWIGLSERSGSKNCGPSSGIASSTPQAPGPKPAAL